MKYFLWALGCQMNKSDGERIAATLESLGYQKTKDEREANLIGVVACSVRQTAIDRIYGKIAEWNTWKNERPLTTFVSGCMLPADQEKFLKKFDLVFKVDDLASLPELLGQDGATVPAAYWQVEPKWSSHFEAYITIQNGCDKFCTYCAVPYTRGRERSRPSQEILDEIRGLAEKGYTHFTLLGQNVNSYGLDKPGEEISFAELLRQTAKIEGDFWVHFTSPHPRDMTDEVLQVIAQYPKLANQIHLPLQAGDDLVLKRMNRPYTQAQFLAQVERFRNILPTADLSTDCIVGFPGETREQFEQTVKVFKTAKFDMAYIAKYSPRPGAVSSRFADNVPKEEKEERWKILTEVLRQTALEKSQTFVGKTIRVLVDGYDRAGFLTGKNEGLKIVRINQKESPASTALVGTFVDVIICSARPFSLSGDLVLS
ncbi:MAG: tRNA (N6-isopentenyl adenosine(37)-C2)-methylthiotransferase MiaB [Patescibacteria group bacterium]